MNKQFLHNKFHAIVSLLLLACVSTVAIAEQTNQSEEAYPWIIRFDTRDTSLRFCGGVLVHPYWVLTTASCGTFVVMQLNQPDVVQVALSADPAVTQEPRGILLDFLTLPNPTLDAIKHQLKELDAQKTDVDPLPQKLDVGLVRLHKPFDLPLAPLGELNTDKNHTHTAIGFINSYEDFETIYYQPRRVEMYKEKGCEPCGRTIGKTLLTHGDQGSPVVRTNRDGSKEVVALVIGVDKRSVKTLDISQHIDWINSVIGSTFLPELQFTVNQSMPR